MAAPTINFGGFVYSDNGNPVEGVPIHIYDKNDTTTAREASSITTNSAGYWSAQHATAGEFDIEIVNGTTTKRRIKFDDQIHLSEIDVEKLSIRGNNTAIAPLYFYADQGADAGDQWRIDGRDGGVLGIGNDINSQGVFVDHVTFTPNSTVTSSTVAFLGNVSVATALVPDASDGAALGTTALEWSDLYLADGAVIGFGDDQEVTLTHVHDTGVLLSSTDRLQFGDAGTFIHQSSDGVLTIESDTTVDINGAVALNGAVTGATDVTLSGELDAATLDLSGSADIAGDLVLSGGADGALQFTHAGENSIKIPDNQGSALIIEEANNAYITFDTQDGAEAITVAKATTFSAGIANAGTIAAGTWNGTAITGAYINDDIISGQSEITSGLAAADELLYSDAGTVKRVGVDTLTTYLAGVNAGTVTTTGLSDSSGVIKLDIQSMTASTTIADADLIVIDDGAGGTLRKMTRANFIESAALDAINIDGGAIDGTPIGANSESTIQGTTIDASTDFTIGDTVITNGVITDSSGLQLAANLDIDGTVDISADLTLSGGADGALQFTNDGENSIKIPDNQSSALIIEEANNAYITFNTSNSSEAITVAKATTFNDGVELSDGNLKVASGHGVDFSSTADAGGMTGELLDDYEEGTWTPVILSGGSAMSGQNLSSTATYVKVGSVCHVQFDTTCTAIGTGNSSAYLSGLPFTAASSAGRAQLFIGFFDGLNKNVVRLGGDVNGGGVFADLYDVASAADSVVRAGATDLFQNSARFMGSCTYTTT